MTRGFGVVWPSSGDLYSDNATITLQERPHEACRSFEQALPWALGSAALMRNLARRGLLPEPQ